MAVQPSNPCPACNKKPDIPGELKVFTEFSFLPGGIFFCNHCGAKLQVTRSIWAMNSAPYKLTFNSPLKPGPLKRLFPQTLLGVPFAFATSPVSDIPSNELVVSLWVESTKKAFVSYSHKDDAFCHPFADALKADGFDVFFDNGSIGSGTDWVQEIGKAIEECHFFIAVLTPDAWGSEWVERELNTAIAARRTIIPVLLKDTTVQGILRSVQWIDVRGQTPEQAAKLVAETMKKAK